MPFAPFAAMRRWMNPQAAAQQQAVVAGGATVIDPTIPLFKGEPIPRYPDRGVAAPAVTPEMLLESQADLIKELHQASSFSYPEFDTMIRPAIRNYAAFVHLLPASETNHHCGQGGLFRHGLEVARNAAIACEAKVFAMDRWASERHQLTPRWRMCAILGGMVHDLGKPLIDVGAVDASGEKSWNPHTSSLWDWLETNGLDHYYIHWRPGARFKRHEAFTNLALYRIVPPVTMDWIGQHGGQEPFDALVMALTTAADPRNPLSALIKQADSKSVDRDIKDSRERLSASGMGGQRNLAARLVRAMHDAIEAGTWQINKLANPIWVTTEGVFGMFPAVISEAINALREQGETALPKDIGTALDLLADWGYLHPQIHADGQSTSTWNLRIHAQDRGKPAIFDAHVVRFAREEIIPAASLPPIPLVAEMLGPNGQVLSAGVVSPAHSAPAATPHAAPAEPAAPASTSEPDPNASPAPTPPQIPEGALLRDRGNEPDVRTEQIDEANKNYNAPFPPTTPEGAHAWLSDSGQQPEGAALAQIAKRVLEGALREGAHVFDVHERIHLRSPDAFQDLGFDPTELRTKLEARGWTETDSPTLQRTTVTLDHGGKRIPCTRLTGGLSTVFRLLLPARTPAQLAAAAPRTMAVGPWIDAAAASRIRSLIKFDAADAWVVRPILHRYLLKCAHEQGTKAELLDGDQINRLFNGFASSHGIRQRTWWLQHVLNGQPSVCVRGTGDDAGNESNAQQPLRFNTAYDPMLERDPEPEQALA